MDKCIRMAALFGFITMKLSNLHTSSEHTQAGFRGSGSVMGIGYLSQGHPSPERFKPA